MCQKILDDVSPTMVTYIVNFHLPFLLQNNISKNGDQVSLQPYQYNLLGYVQIQNGD